MPIQKEILREGRFHGAGGKIFVSTLKKMQSIIDNFDETTGLNSLGNPVSFCIAHPASDTPSFGWAKKFFMKGDRLWVEFKDVLPKMQKWLADKSFTEVSAALMDFPTKTIARHIGCLGAWPPAVSALEDFKLNKVSAGTIQLNDEDEFVEVDLSEEIINNPKGGSHMPKTIEEYATALAESKVEVTTLKGERTTLTAAAEASKATIETEKTRADEATTKLTESEKKVVDLEKENKEFKEAAEKAEAGKADLADGEELNKLITAKKIMPGEKEAHLMTLQGLRDKKEQEYELSEGKKENRTPRDHYLKTLEARPELEFEAPAFEKGKKSEHKGLTKLEAAIKVKMSSDKELNYGKAMSAVLSENPDMNKAVYANEPA